MDGLQKDSITALKPSHTDRKAGIYLFHSESHELMQKISERNPDGVFDMIFADPPYLLSNGGISCSSGKVVSVNKGKWDKSQGPELDFQSTLTWLSLCQKLLKKDGTIWVSGTRHNIFMVGYAMQLLGMKMLNDIVWEKPNPPPNLSCRYFTHSTESIIWAAKNHKSKHHFEYELMKDHAGGKQMKSVWKFLPPNASEKTFGKHPTQKPVGLLERIILSSTKEDDLILDPFTGSSTTGVAAKLHGRRFVGIDSELDFIELSARRLGMEHAS